MSIRLERPWIPLQPYVVARVRDRLGVHEIVDENGEVIFVGYAGGHSRFGLRGELEARCREEPEGRASDVRRRPAPCAPVATPL